MADLDVNQFLNLPYLDEISLDVKYIHVLLSTFCKMLGITQDELLEDL